MNPLLRWLAWPIIAIALLLGGCSSMRSGGAPDPVFSIQDDLNALKESLSAYASVATYHAGAKTAETRNAFVDARVAMANLAYIQFISDLTADKQQIDTASEMLVLGLNLLGTTATGVRAKGNLAALAAGVSGSKATIDKNFFYEKTSTALVAMMSARRKEVLVRIVEGTRNPLAQYTFTQALADTYEYYAAGTLSAAIMSVQADASSRDAQAEQKLVNLGELVVLTDEQIGERETVTNAIIALLKGNDLSSIQGALKLLGLEGLKQANLAEAKASLRDNYRRVLRDKPDLAKTLKGKI